MRKMSLSIQHVAGVDDRGPVRRGTQPKRYIECDDGEIYIAKGTANPEGSRELFNELLAASLAQLLGIPVPRHAIIRIGSDLVEGFVGTYFGTLRMEDYEPLPSGSMLTGADCYEPSIYSIFAFDELLKNPDRKAGDLLRHPGDQTSPIRFLVIDHANALTGSHWTAEHLSINHVGIAGYTADWLFRGVRSEPDALHEAENIRQAVDKFEDIVLAVASCCEFSDTEVAEVVSFLKARAVDLPNLVTAALDYAEALGRG